MGFGCNSHPLLIPFIIVDAKEGLRDSSKGLRFAVLLRLILVSVDGRHPPLDLALQSASVLYPFLFNIHMKSLDLSLLLK